jgi:hypothetical protein
MWYYNIVKIIQYKRIVEVGKVPHALAMSQLSEMPDTPPGPQSKRQLRLSFLESLFCILVINFSVGIYQ